jgi:hypothetical protein
VDKEWTTEVKIDIGFLCGSEDERGEKEKRRRIRAGGISF